MTDLEEIITSFIEEMKKIEYEILPSLDEVQQKERVEGRSWLDLYGYEHRIGNKPAPRKDHYRVTYFFREAGGGIGRTYEVWSYKWPNPPSNPRNHGEYVRVNLIR